MSHVCLHLSIYLYHLPLSMKRFNQNINIGSKLSSSNILNFTLRYWMTTQKNIILPNILAIFKLPGPKQLPKFRYYLKFESGMALMKKTKWCLKKITNFIGYVPTHRPVKFMKSNPSLQIHSKPKFLIWCSVGRRSIQVAPSKHGDVAQLLISVSHASPIGM